MAKCGLVYKNHQCVWKHGLRLWFGGGVWASQRFYTIPFWSEGTIGLHYHQSSCSALQEALGFWFSAYESGWAIQRELAVAGQPGKMNLLLFLLLLLWLPHATCELQWKAKCPVKLRIDLANPLNYYKPGDHIVGGVIATTSTLALQSHAFTAFPLQGFRTNLNQMQCFEGKSVFNYNLLAAPKLWGGRQVTGGKGLLTLTGPMLSFSFILPDGSLVVFSLRLLFSLPLEAHRHQPFCPLGKGFSFSLMYFICWLFQCFVVSF